MRPVAVRVDVNPELLAWARERSGVDLGDLTRRFPKLAAWEDGVLAPTLKQLESFAHVTKTPVGYLFLEEPPEEPLPIPDYRTRQGRAVARPTPDLLDSLFQCLQRQEWYREYARDNGQGALAFVGSLSTATPVVEAARAIRSALAYDVNGRGSTWSAALRRLIDQAESLGVLVMVNGVVGNNTHRKLDPDEFQGFALVDPVAPVVFVNGADTKAAQIFTLAHELAHVWVGQSALSDAEVRGAPATEVERWCNHVAAELLVPLAVIRKEFRPQEPIRGALDRLATRFKVSTLVIIRRLHEARLLSADAYYATFEAELERLRDIMAVPAEGGGGGDFGAMNL